MRIAVYTHEFPPDHGGAGVYCHNLAAHLAEAGHEVSVWVGRPTWHVDRTPVPSDPPGVRLKRFGCGPFAHPNYLLAGAVVREFARRERPDVVIAGEGTAQLAVGGVPLPRRTRLVMTVHGTEALGFMRTRARRFFYERTLKRSIGIVACSGYAGEIGRDACREAGLEPRPVCVAPAGIDVDAFSGAVDEDATAGVRDRYGLGDGPLILALGRLVPRKGHDVAIRAMRRVAEEVPDATYAIAGDGPYRRRLEQIARECGVLDANVRFLGAVPEEDKIPLLDASSLFMLLSRQEGVDVEGFGIVFAEAAMRRVPSVGGRHGGVKEAIHDGETGLLVDPTDADAAAEAVLRLLRDPDLRRRMGDAGHDRAVREFDWAVLARRVAGFIESL